MMEGAEVQMCRAPPLPPKTRQKSASRPADSVSSSGSAASSRPCSTVFLAASNQQPVPVQQPTSNGHVVTIKINPTENKVKEDNRTKVSLNQSPNPINTIGKFIVNICESNDEYNTPDGCVRISVGGEEMVQKTESLSKGGEMTNPYFFYPCSPNLMSSGQCSPSDTMDSGTCSDLDGTPPPLPKKKSAKRVSVTVINRSAEVDSEDSESNISCDSLNSSDLSSQHSLHEDTSSHISFKSDIQKAALIVSECRKSELETIHRIPNAPTMPAFIDTSNDSSGYLPQGLLQDIRERSVKLNSVPVITQETTKTTWVDLGKKESPVKIIETIKQDEKLTSFKLVSQASTNNNRKLVNSNQPIIVDAIPAYPKVVPIVNESTYEDRKLEQEKKQKQEQMYSGTFLYDTDKYYNFHLNENVFDDESADNNNKKKSEKSAKRNGCSDSDIYDEDSSEYFAGIKDYKHEDGPATIRSAKGTIRGVKNRVRAGIATFLQMQNTTAKSYREKDAGKVVLYSTSMGIVRGTYQKCVLVKKILRNLLVKFEERDVFMSCEYQEEIKDRMHSSDVLVPQLFVDGQHIGDADTVEKLNEAGELRRMLKPYKSADACSTCQMCGGYRLLPCQVCCGSKKSVHRNHFTAEFVALKCMNCDEVGLVKCEAC